MSKDAGTLEVQILGREFRIACTDDEKPDLLLAVDYLDRKMRDIRDQGKVIGTERIAVMAALNMAHELLNARVPGGFDVGEVKRRMQTLQTAIDSALSTQDQLF
ncbi:MAG: cell division protein ZapA [Betaproteobacteria bacterium]